MGEALTSPAAISLARHVADCPKMFPEVGDFSSSIKHCMSLIKTSTNSASVNTTKRRIHHTSGFFFFPIKYQTSGYLTLTKLQPSVLMGSQLKIEKLRIIFMPMMKSKNRTFSHKQFL